MLVLGLTAGLFLSLVQEARAVDLEFVSPPSTVGSSATFRVKMTIPSGQIVPMESVIAVVERQATGATDKVGAVQVTSARCSGLNAAGDQCAAGSLVKDSSLANPDAVSTIQLVSYTSVTSGYTVGAADARLDCPCSFTHPGYGYDTLTAGLGYGYGYDLGLAGTGYNEGSGYGYGYATDGGLIILFDVTLAGASLTNGQTHYLTLVVITGSAVLGEFHSPSTEFSVSVGGGGGGGAGSVAVQTNFPASPSTIPPGALASYRATVTATAATTITITTPDAVIPSVTFTPATALSGATVTVTRWPATATPPGTEPVPDGFTPSSFVTITISSGGTTHSVVIAVRIPEADVPDPAKAALLKFDPATGAWVAQSAIALTLSGGFYTGSASSLCCSDYVVGFDTQAPNITLVVPDGVLSGVQTLTVGVTDNLRVAKVEAFVAGALVATDTEAPYSFNVDTRLVPDGLHTVEMRATDLVGNVASKDFAVAVSNAGPPVDDDSPMDKVRDAIKDWEVGLVVMLVLVSIAGAVTYFYTLQRKKD